MTRRLINANPVWSFLRLCAVLGRLRDVHQARKLLETIGGVSRLFTNNNEGSAGSMAERLTTNQEVPGSTPGWIVLFA